MTQETEALEMMSCVRCGRFSGPELLCAHCDAADAEGEDDRPFLLCVRCHEAVWLDEPGWCYEERGVYHHAACPSPSTQTPHSPTAHHTDAGGTDR